MSHIVQVVSIEDVMISDGWTMFQSRDVIGAVCSGDLEFESSARGESFCSGWSPFDPCLVMVFDEYEDVSLGKDHSLKWSPEVASKSVLCLFEDGGSHSILVTGYAWFASAVFTKSKPLSPCGFSGSTCVFCASRI